MLASVYLLLISDCDCALDLSEFVRSGRQLSGEDGVALGLVTALQKWATTLESDSSSLKQQLADIQLSNTKLLDEVKTLKSQNINLKNEVSQANERSSSIKNLYQKLGDEFNKVEKQNNELKTAFQVGSFSFLCLRLYTIH